MSICDGRSFHYFLEGFAVRSIEEVVLSLSMVLEIDLNGLTLYSSSFGLSGDRLDLISHMMLGLSG